MFIESRAKYKVLDDKTNAYPQFMWFRIVSLDRNLCLMLGLTQGSFDQSMATGTVFMDDIPMGRLESMHCTLASQILERNESDPYANESALTQSLDLELQKAGRSMPSKWWLMPNLGSVINNLQALLFDMGRLFNQLYHYNLLNQLHLPYILRSSQDRKHEYSRIICLILFALMAAITLLLAHLDSHRFPQTNNLLAYQYLSDRAMIEQAQVNIEQISRVNGDTLSAQINAQSPISNGQPLAPVVGMQNSDSSDTAVGGFGSGRSDGNDFSRSIIESNYNSVDNMNGPSEQLASRCPGKVSDALPQNSQDPGLTAGVDDWAFQGVGMAFFDSIMRGLDNGNTSETWVNNS
ncbi:hypothetical protein N7481_005000 [Penicillium waksmanii]|uniref:uncharacterized protein n=1 Tax=Penicillium waksmanii TaxID=69791 RepID=UPI00254728F8|nr:uncharacterized protein N7481_005000 [Penicillium waksmanii]KAJ5982901.1 hypothetical protein N7481_005000 [Penicillium waksmanii]